jgi:GNAT superfamily N-acetyltransferase
VIAVRQPRAVDAASLFLLVTQFPTPTRCAETVFYDLFEAKLKDSAACLLVAEHEGALVGYVSGSARSAFYVGGMTAWIDEILVLPELRRAGIGRRLMEAFEAWAQDLHCRSVALATRGAALFYERLGYATTAGYFKKYLDAAQQQ